MSLPIYTCGHSHLPLPFYVTYPPPTHLPHLCRPCHHAACIEAEQDAHSAHDNVVLHLDQYLKQMSKSLARNWDSDRYNEMLRIQERRECRLDTRDLRLKEIWAEFDRLWGGPFSSIARGKGRFRKEIS